MANSVLTVVLEPGVEVPLNTDNPNIGELVNQIVKHKDTIDTKKIKVNCSKASKFDTKSFTEVISDSVKQFLDSIRLEKDAYDAICLALEGEKDSGE